MAAYQMALCPLKRLPGLSKAFNPKVFRARCVTGLFALLSLLCGDVLADASEDAQRIQQVKAAFILNIARFVTWPSDESEKENAPYILCLYRSNPLGPAIETIRGKRITSQHHLQVKTISKVEESGNCTILFVPQMELSSFQADMGWGLKRSLLTITDLTADDADTEVSRKGVMVSMIRAGARIGLEVDLEKTRNAGLRVSSQLLKLARIVNNGS
jgi:hypothetical protein